jgi:hypothetical protein
MCDLCDHPELTMDEHLDRIRQLLARERLAVAVHGPAVRALQLAWCDAAGRWPWEPGHRARRAGEPVLGRRAPWHCDEHRQDRLDVPPHP